MKKAIPKTDAEITALLDVLVGKGNYVYDGAADLWVAPDPSYTGPGKGFILLERAGYWSKAVVPDGARQ